jgi:acid phosphatase type 7
MENAHQQGQTSPRPPKKRSQAHPGIHPLSQLVHQTQRFQPLPKPLGLPPYHFELETAVPGLAKTIADAGKLVLHIVGDTGGIKNADYQAQVAKAMKGDLNNPVANRPVFFYHLGDVVYFNGETDKYYDQFYEPYDHYNAPIISIPGNHDGDPLNASQTSLDGWVGYFMTEKPHVDPISKDAPRVTMSLPNVYFMLDCPFATFVGLYTNVPEGGSIDSVQQQWVTNEFGTAPDNKALIVCLHHPVYSFDDNHSGSSRMADVLQNAINDTRRVPNLVMMGHVHNYQRIEKEIIPGVQTPFIVSGNGGYFHLHGLTAAAGESDDQTGAKLIFGDDKNHGYTILSVDSKSISGTVFAIDKVSGKATVSDTFKYPTKKMVLNSGNAASL